MRLAPLLAIAATAAAHRTKPNSSSSLAVGAKQNKKHGKRNNEKGREKHLNNPISVLAHEIEKVTKSDKDDKEGDIPELADQHDVALIESMNPTYQPSPEELEFASINVDTSQSPSVSPKMLVEHPTEAKDTMLTSPTETQSMDGGEPALPCPPAYDPTHTKYVAGDKVEVDNYIWECRPYPYDMYCSIPQFKPSLKEENPDAEELWLMAWSTARAVCYKTENPTISLSEEPTPAPSLSILTPFPTQSPLRLTDPPSLAPIEPVQTEADQGFPLPIPVLRFTEWSELGDSEKATAESIGYDKYSWNNLEISDIEQKAFKDLSSSEQQGAMALGFDERTWDCYMNHYYSYSWSELKDANVVQHFEKLGWTRKSWVGSSNPPISDELSWYELSLEEQNAATQICYSANAWDWIALPSW